MILIKILLRGIQVFVLLIMLGWLGMTAKVSGSYFVDHFVAQLFGKSVAGRILEVHKNPEIDIAGNYLARVAFPGPAGEPLTADFRYAREAITSSPTVTVVYLSAHPKIALLREDGGYFKDSLPILGYFFGFFLISFGVPFSLDWWLFRRKKVQAFDHKR